MKLQPTNLKKPASLEAGFFYSYDYNFFQTPKNTSSKELV
ncbi:hypothetical protein HMPREF9388_0824 [Streptococcus sanguinis SK353]|uniref:Uncharacterized protein n=1 Tax=Streptococcus sanguinis SK353 TaxID=888815 RepID=F0FDP2_STRSA|nr:hypothetical protein HMPREF9388_0824 [Streptococcus sanguinis SK353]